jgi:hypothetical protein
MTETKDAVICALSTSWLIYDGFAWFEFVVVLGWRAADYKYFRVDFLSGKVTPS